MNTKIKKYADSGDIKSLKYIFVDSLDVDPTFVRYEEEYNYCKSIPGLIENHIEDTEELLWLEWEMVKYNFGFLANINPLTLLLKGINKVFEAFKSTVTSTQSSDTSLPKEQ